VTCTAASRASAAAGAVTTCFSPFPARRATSAPLPPEARARLR
jgi:hypothetical protein